MSRCVLVLLALAACQTEAKDSELEQARTEARRFFHAVDARDCTTIASLLPAVKDPAACTKLLHEWHDDLQTKLLDLPDVRHDGRDRRAIIVRATVTRRGQERSMLLRMKRDGGVWQLAL